MGEGEGRVQAGSSSKKDWERDLGWEELGHFIWRSREDKAAARAGFVAAGRKRRKAAARNEELGGNESLGKIAMRVI